MLTSSPPTNYPPISTPPTNYPPISTPPISPPSSRNITPQTLIPNLYTLPSLSSSHFPPLPPPSQVSPSPSSSKIKPISTMTNKTIPPPPPSSNTHGMLTRSKNNIHKPKAFLLAPTTTPTTYKLARRIPHWNAAMQAEYNALMQNHTWKLVPYDSSKNVVECKWLFRVKRRPDGTIDRYKARLVAKGFTQRPGIDYNATFSPVVKPTTVRIMLTYAVQHNWPLHQLDVNNAFLQGHLDEEVFMKQPPGFEDTTNPHHLCRLDKAIYGLKQAPRAWYTALKTFLQSQMFYPSQSDTSLFIYHLFGISMYVLIYVDDIIITGNCSITIQHLLTVLSSRLSLKDLGPFHYFLGVEVIPYSDGLLLSQERYVNDILRDVHMQNCNGAPTPMTSTTILTSQPAVEVIDAVQYRSTVGKLQYLSFTRPNIAFLVNNLS